MVDCIVTGHPSPLHLCSLEALMSRVELGNFSFTRNTPSSLFAAMLSARPQSQVTDATSSRLS